MLHEIFRNIDHPHTRLVAIRQEHRLFTSLRPDLRAKSEILVETYATLPDWLISERNLDCTEVDISVHRHFSYLKLFFRIVLEFRLAVWCCYAETQDVCPRPLIENLNNTAEPGIGIPDVVIGNHAQLFL